MMTRSRSRLTTSLWFVAAVLVIYQLQLIEERTREGCFKAFRNNNWVGFAIWAGLALDLYFRLRISQ